VQQICGASLCASPADFVAALARLQCGKHHHALSNWCPCRVALDMWLDGTSKHVSMGWHWFCGWDIHSNMCPYGGALIVWSDVAELALRTPILCVPPTEEYGVHTHMKGRTKSCGGGSSSPSMSLIMQRGVSSALQLDQEVRSANGTL
jgi:hypothetical protein